MKGQPNREEDQASLLSEGRLGPNQSAADPGICSCLSVKYYQPLFDVDTKDVVDRMLMSVLPHKATGFLQMIKDSPDFYGPFWVSTTLLFTIAVVGNLLSWTKFQQLQGSSAEDSWEYDFEMVVTCMCVVYGWAVGAPVALWFTLRYLLVQIKLATVGCAYGYSLVPFVPAALLCGVPADWVSWLVLLLAGMISSLFLLRVFGGLVLGNVPKQAVMILGVLGVTQIFLAITIKMVFFP